MKIITTIALIASFVFLPRHEAAAQPPNNLNSVAACGVAVVVIAVGAVIVYQLKSLCDRVLPPIKNPPTPPSQTNSPSIKMMAQNIPAITLNLSDEGVNYGDISAAGFKDRSGNLYHTIFSSTLQSSTNLLNWKPECSVTGWVSSETMCMVCYCGGLPQSTNWCSMGSPTITCNLGTAGASPPSKFFRLVSQ